VLKICHNAKPKNVNTNPKRPTQQTETEQKTPTFRKIKRADFPSTIRFKIAHLILSDIPKPAHHPTLKRQLVINKHTDSDKIQNDKLHLTNDVK
jgi:hypothetical protein